MAGIVVRAAFQLNERPQVTMRRKKKENRKEKSDESEIVGDLGLIMVICGVQLNW